MSTKKARMTLKGGAVVDPDSGRNDVFASFEYCLKCLHWYFNIFTCSH